MKDPVETIEKFLEFNHNIEMETWKVNFLFTEGYYKFIEDLMDAAACLATKCGAILSDRKYRME
jgi:hypothetical protein